MRNNTTTILLLFIDQDNTHGERQKCTAYSTLVLGVFLIAVEGGYLAVMYLLGWGGVIFLCSVSHPEKSGNFLLVWAVLSGAKQFYGHRSEIMWTITAGTQKC